MLRKCTTYRLPFDGRWFVIAGGDTINVNHHMAETSQWYGLDFMKTGGLENRAIARNDGEELEDYYAWGQPVLSPAKGIIRTVYDGEPDNPIDVCDEENAFANHVVVEVGRTEFVYIAHLRKGSVSVVEGQRIAAGQLLGECGNSGNSDAPHIHMHVQSRKGPYSGTGKNITFYGICVLLAEKRFDNVDWPLIQGLFVWQNGTG